jgi:hypothetical protein
MENFIMYSLNQILEDKIRENEIGGACNMN